MTIATKRTATSTTLNSLDRACLAARVAVDNKARDVTVLDMRGITPLYDFFVLCTGNSRRQIHTISEEIDALAAYCPDLERCFLVPIARIDGRPTVHLRVAPTRNNQVRRVNRAEEFEFAATLRALTGP